MNTLNSATKSRPPFMALISAVIFTLGALVASYAQDGNRADYQISESVQSHLGKAQACLDTYDIACARNALNSIPSSNLSDFERYRYWNQLAWIEYLDGNFAEAVTTYQNAYALTDNRGQQVILRNMAQLYASMGQFHEAYDALEQLLVLKGEYPLGMGHLTAEGLWLGLNVYVIGSWDLVPLVPGRLAFPDAAAKQGLQTGYVDVELTVTRTGTTRDIRVVKSSAAVFEQEAIEAAENLKFKPRVVDGEPVDVTGFQHRFEFTSNE